jgi:hypothetical protein
MACDVEAVAWERKKKKKKRNEACRNFQLIYLSGKVKACDTSKGRYKWCIYHTRVDFFSYEFEVFPQKIETAVVSCLRHHCSFLLILVVHNLLDTDATIAFVGQFPLRQTRSYSTIVYVITTVSTATVKSPLQLALRLLHPLIRPAVFRQHKDFETPAILEFQTVRFSIVVAFGRPPRRRCSKDVPQSELPAHFEDPASLRRDVENRVRTFSHSVQLISKRRIFVETEDQVARWWVVERSQKEDGEVDG